MSRYINPGMLANPWRHVEDVLGIPPCVANIPCALGGPGAVVPFARPMLTAPVPPAQPDTEELDELGDDAAGDEGGAGTEAEPVAPGVSPALVPAAVVAQRRAPLVLPPPRRAAEAPAPPSRVPLPPQQMPVQHEGGRQRPALTHRAAVAAERHATFVERTTRYDATRALLDELMGSDRDAGGALPS